MCRNANADEQLSLQSGNCRDTGVWRTPWQWEGHTTFGALQWDGLVGGGGRAFHAEAWRFKTIWVVCREFKVVWCYLSFMLKGTTRSEMSLRSGCSDGVFGARTGLFSQPLEFWCPISRTEFSFKKSKQQQHQQQDLLGPQFSHL